MHMYLIKYPYDVALQTVSSRAEHEGAAADLDERIDADISKLSLDT